ncbi:MAG: PAS domain-containing protein [Bacteroides sp.]|nr:PAS domain-containing protein [Bacteroides sp.]MCM1551048.1 PAS domain-containing protein [Clostridium sp.]
MELSAYFQSIVDQDLCAVVICNLEHEVLYMNPAAKARYAKQGGAALIGSNLLHCHSARSQEKIQKVLAWFQEGTDHNRVFTFHNEKENKDVYMIALRDETGRLIGYYEKHEYRDREKGELYHLS